MADVTTVFAKLTAVQTKLKAPKNQFNKFGNYKYRSCEDILEALKPVLREENASVFISDSIEPIEGRFYVKSTATFIDSETGETVSNTAYAREPESKKGSDESQITGASSSYARKYALNGLFLIDDTKDEDTEERANERASRAKKAEPKREAEPPKKAEAVKAETPKEEIEIGMNEPIEDDPLLPNGTGMTKVRLKLLHEEMERTGIPETTVLSLAKVKAFEDIPEATYIAIMHKFEKTPNKEDK